MAEHDELIADARDQTGLGDFGDDSFREGLEVLVWSLQGEAKLNAMGQEAMRSRLVEPARATAADRGLVPPAPRDG